MKKIKRIAVLSLAVVLTAFAAACSDGELLPQETALNISPPAPIIIAFHASPEEVPSGGTTTISWEVAGADSVEITAASSGTALSSFHVESEELMGSAPATNLTATTDFVLTARKTIAVPAASAPAPAADAVVPADPATPAPATPSESSVSQTITVRVISAAGVSVAARADSTSLTPGQKTILHWDVTPSDATVEVKDAAGEDVTPTFAGPDCEGTDAEALLTNGTPTTNPEAVGCAVVDPTATTTYRVTATKEGSESQTTEVTVNVATAGTTQATIQVNGSDHAQVTNAQAEVTVSWTASGPVGSTVTVTATPPVASCTPALPQNTAITAEMPTSSRCRLSALPTTFTIEVTTAPNATPVQDSADVALSPNVQAGIDIVSDQWAFAGEQVTLTFTPQSGTERSSIREIRITDKVEGTKVIQGIPQGPVRVVVPEAGVSVTAVDTTGAQHPYGIKVAAIPMLADSVAGSDEDIEVTELTLDPNNPSSADAVRNRFTGIKMADYNGGKADIFINGSNRTEIDMESMIESWLFDRPNGDPRTRDDFADHAGALKTNIIAVRPGNSGEVYAGVTGGLTVSNNGGNTFTLLIPVGRLSEDGINYNGQHNSCRSKIQTGLPKTRENQFLALNQICDIVIGRNGRLIMATDDDTYSISDIQKFRNNDPTVTLKGRDTPLHRKVTDSLVCIDDDCTNVFAGTEMGVYKTTNGGEAWEQFGSLSTKVFSLAILGDKLYAGTEDSLYESSTSAASFRAVGLAGKKVYALAVDRNIGPFGTTIIAGTNAGVFVTRDTGANWSQMSTLGAGESLAVATASVEAPGNTKKISVLVGVGKQSLAGEVLVARAAGGAAGGSNPPPGAGGGGGQPTTFVTVPSLVTFTRR